MILLGGLGLYAGAEWLVSGASGLARSFGISSFVVGLTVVAYGTSAPEFVVSCGAAWEGRSAIALGNVIGSNIANLGLILGITALIAPPRVERGLVYRELPALLASVLVLPLLLLDGRIGRIEAACLLAAALLFTFALLRMADNERVERPKAGQVKADEEPRGGSRVRLAAVALAGLAVLLVGGKLFVDGAVRIALILGLSERVIALTIVAIGTSLPELAASTVAALRGHSAIAVGNVIGSNVFNILLILGASGLVSPIEGTLAEYRVDLAVVIGLTLLGVVSLRTERFISRVEGAMLLGVYVAFLALVAYGSTG